MRTEIVFLLKKSSRKGFLKIGVGSYEEIVPDFIAAHNSKIFSHPNRALADLYMKFELLIAKIVRRFSKWPLPFKS